MTDDRQMAREPLNKEAMMAARIRIEWVRFGYGPDMDKDDVAHNVIKSFHGAEEISVITTATPDDERPTAPAFGEYETGYALVRCFADSDYPVVMTKGVDPQATALNGKLIAPGEEVPFAAKTGEVYSFIGVP